MNNTMVRWGFSENRDELSCRAQPATIMVSAGPKSEPLGQDEYQIVNVSSYDDAWNINKCASKWYDPVAVIATGTNHIVFVPYNGYASVGQIFSEDLNNISRDFHKAIGVCYGRIGRKSKIR